MMHTYMYMNDICILSLNAQIYVIQWWLIYYFPLTSYWKKLTSRKKLLNRIPFKGVVNHPVSFSNFFQLSHKQYNLFLYTLVQYFTLQIMIIYIHVNYLPSFWSFFLNLHVFFPHHFEYYINN